MKGLAGLFVGTLCAIVVACSAASKPAQTMPVAARPDTSAGPMSDPHGQLTELARQVEAERVELDLPAVVPTPMCSGPACARGAREMAAGITAPTLVCRPGDGDTCKQTCTLSDSICSNVKKICEIASQLDGDPWAAQKCTDGNQTCKAAKARCCDCTK